MSLPSGRSISRLIALTILLASVACGASATEPGTAVTATPSAAGIVLSNRSDFPVDLFIIGEGALAVWDTGPCFPGSLLPAHGTQTVPWSAIFGYTPSETRYHLTWWRDKLCASGPASEFRGGTVVIR
ncbi:MAG: hypothetical protein ABJE47_16855 [bacterium]